MIKANMDLIDSLKNDPTESNIQKNNLRAEYVSFNLLTMSSNNQEFEHLVKNKEQPIDYFEAQAQNKLKNKCKTKRNRKKKRNRVFSRFK